MLETDLTTPPAPQPGDRKSRKLQTAMVEIDRDEDYWLVTGKRARRRQLTRTEFLELVRTCSVIVIRAHDGLRANHDTHAT